MKNSTIEQILDDAVNLMASGIDPQLCAQQCPAHQQEIEPLLRVASQLMSYAEESIAGLQEAEAIRRPIDWVALLADVPQTDEVNYATQPAGTLYCPTRGHDAPARRRRNKANVAASRIHH